MNGQLLQHLSSIMFDEAHPHFPHTTNSTFGRTETVSVTTNDAIFILVSDLGEQTLNSSMGRDDARCVHRYHLSLPVCIHFNLVCLVLCSAAVREATRKHWPTTKMLKFVHEVVPFLPLSLEEMAKVAELELKRTSNLMQVRTVARLPTISADRAATVSIICVAHLGSGAILPSQRNPMGWPDIMGHRCDLVYSKRSAVARVLARNSRQRSTTASETPPLPLSCT